MWLGRGLWFFFDEWSFVTERRLDVVSLLTPHNGHLSVVLVFLYVMSLKIFGADGFEVLRIIAVLVHVSIAFGAYLVVGRRKGWAPAMLALVVVGTLGSGWQNVLWPFQIGMMLPVAMSLFAVHWVESRPESTWSVGMLVLIALLSAGGGVTLLVAVLLHSVVVQAWKRSAILVGIAVVYVAWYVAYGVPQGWGFRPWMFTRYVGESAVLSAAAIGGRGVRFGEVVLVLGFVAVVSQLPRRFREASLVIPLLTVGIGWVMTAYSRWLLWEPGASRYVYVGAAFLLVLFLVALPLRSSRLTTPLIAVTAIFLVVPNVRLMNDGGRLMTERASRVRAELAVLDALGDRGLPEYRPDPGLAPQIFAGTYLSAASMYGDFGNGITGAGQRSKEDRVNMDRVAFQYLRVRVSPPEADIRLSDCSWMRLAPGAEISLEMEAVFIDAKSGSSLSLTMFADTPTPDTTLSLDTGEVVGLWAPSPEPLPRWKLTGSAPVRVGVCQGLQAQG